ncbi:MAG: nuclear transport factor 2 family protein [Candidatus Puniceispirillales bacterium]
MPGRETIITAYAEAFARLSPDNMDELISLLADDVVFIDPFNHTKGKAAFARIFEHMFETCTDPRFSISDIAHGNEAAYLRWQMTARLRSWPRSPLLLEGMSEIRINTEGRISHHIDHWDSASQLLMALPVIRVIIRPIMRLFKVG